MTEMFIPIKGYEGLYEVSNLGKVKSLPKYKGTNYSQAIKEKILKGTPSGKGYLQVLLCNRGNQKRFLVHRLVAIHFIENHNNLPQVNHKNGNRVSNEASNLEWCTNLENENHAWRTGLKKTKGDNHPTSKRVLQMDLNGNLLKEWTNRHEIKNVLGFSSGLIGDCCNGRFQTAYGFKWGYKKAS
jgi:hypothetical protein